MCRKHCSLPHLTLFDLTVTKQRINAIVLIIQLACKCHTNSRRDTLTERAGAHINAGGTLHVRMTLKHCTYMTKGLQLIHGEIAALRKRRIKTRCTMALTQNKTVSVRALRLFGVNVHFLEIEISENFGSRKRAARMAGLSIENTFNDPKSDLSRHNLQLLLFARIHGRPPIFYTHLGNAQFFPANYTLFLRRMQC